jgi:hypothetical protein
MKLTVYLAIDVIFRHRVARGTEHTFKQKHFLEIFGKIFQNYFSKSIFESKIKTTCES